MENEEWKVENGAGKEGSNALGRDYGEEAEH
jgi:hypothetical protein